MLKIDVKITNNRILELKNKLHNAAKNLSKDAADETVRIAKILVPVDEGTLRDSIEAKEDEDGSWSASPNTDYDVFVEYGTINTPAQPYLTPAAEQAKKKFIGDSKKVFNL